MEKRTIFHGHTVRPIGTPVPHDSQSPAQRIFLLSPANASGIRGNKLLSGRAQFDLALRLPTMGAPLGEIFSFMSSLYFRGKLVYTQRFASPPAGLTGVFVITSSRGLLAPEVIVTVEELRAMSSGSIDYNNPEYRVPLERDAHLLLERIGKDTQVALLGSIATSNVCRPAPRDIWKATRVSMRLRWARRHEPGRIAPSLLPRFNSAGICGGSECRAPGSETHKVEALAALLASQQEQDVKQTEERDRDFENKEAGLIELIDHKLV